ncbi:alpha/beta fold hydrolase [Massilia sp. IC2-476]|uniref:esterase/lipase family protein n=1 Tax=Massilia sp. IC2-476 TaxID=2887199 RepID=UPI001D11D9B5|nr:alpha/beta hydrolase [Massilia sp. IC2-476]
MTPLLQVQTLRRRAPAQVVLIHGLFTNSAFWLPYLERFADFQLTLVSVDYDALLRSSDAPGELAAKIDAHIGDKPAHLIAHSFGCWLAMYLQTSFLSRSFICPTFASQSFDREAFCSQIGQLTTVDMASVSSLVDRAVAFKQTRSADLRYLPDDAFYLPEDDPFFRYVERLECGNTYAYRGGHFDLSWPLAAIAANSPDVSAGATLPASVK